MSFNPNCLRLLTGAFTQPNPTDALTAASSSQQSNLWVYRSSDSSSDLSASAGYFKGCGRGGKLGNSVGMAVGDVIINAPTTIANTQTAGLHVVTSATINTSAATPYIYQYDCSVSADV